MKAKRLSQSLVHGECPVNTAQLLLLGIWEASGRASGPGHLLPSAHRAGSVWVHVCAHVFDPPSCTSPHTPTPSITSMPAIQKLKDAGSNKRGWCILPIPHIWSGSTPQKWQPVLMYKAALNTDADHDPMGSCVQGFLCAWSRCKRHRSGRSPGGGHDNPL